MYLLTYKLSQDHLETFFSCMRRMGGFNNNPTCRQFKSYYKKLITHVNSIVPKESNCSLQDESILKSKTINIQKNSSEELFNLITFEHDYVSTNKWLWTE